MGRWSMKIKPSGVNPLLTFTILGINKTKWKFDAPGFRVHILNIEKIS